MLPCHTNGLATALGRCNNHNPNHHTGYSLVQEPHWRRRPDSNRGTRLCRPLPNHSATPPQAITLARWTGSDHYGDTRCRSHRMMSPRTPTRITNLIVHQKAPTKELINTKMTPPMVCLFFSATTAPFFRMTYSLTSTGTVERCLSSHCAVLEIY